jgi:signal transduction histidine kinase
VARFPSTFIRLLVDQGVTPHLDQPLAKRIRLTNAVSLFGAVLMFASIPFDRLTAPRWMLAEDVLGGLAFLTFPLLNRRGLLTLSRLLCLLVSNLIVLGNAVLLGPESGAPMVFFALAAIPFALFDLGDRAALVAGVLLAVVCYGVAESDRLAFLRSVSDNYSPAVTLAALLFILIQTARANARAERELRENRAASIYSAKMAALGEMSGNIAHEVNNPLMAIQLRAERLIRFAESNKLDADLVVKAAREIENTVQRIARIVDALRSFARDAEKDPMLPERVVVVVSDAVELCAERFRQHAISLEVEPIAADLQVQCRPVQVCQILLNLLSNAHDAVEGRANPWVRIAAHAASDDEVEVSVTDSGPGIPPELQRRIMEPFFTTKEVGRGTGLGLSVSKGIAEVQGGRLAHEPGAPNTRFVLTLKRAAI